SHVGQVAPFTAMAGTPAAARLNASIAASVTARTGDSRMSGVVRNTPSDFAPTVWNRGARSSGYRPVAATRPWGPVIGNTTAGRPNQAGDQRTSAAVAISAGIPRPSR